MQPYLQERGKLLPMQVSVEQSFYPSVTENPIGTVHWMIAA